MKISFRTIKILEYISRKKHITIKDVGEELHIPQRAVRYEIENINGLLLSDKNFKLIDIVRGVLFINDFDLLEKNLKILKEVKTSSKTEREDYIFLKLLFDGNLNLKKLTSELNVCRTTIKKDMFFLEKKRVSLKRNIVFKLKTKKIIDNEKKSTNSINVNIDVSSTSTR